MSHDAEQAVSSWSVVGWAVLAGALLSVGFSFGLYFISPTGSYAEAAFQGVSHDWHSYRFSVLSEGGQQSLMTMGTVFSVLMFVPSLIFVSVLLILLRLIARTFLSRVFSLSAYIVVAGVLAIGFALGVLTTLVEGHVPGSI
jgi:hypothetical protein